MEMNRKVLSIMSRFPDFYESNASSTLLYQLVNVFAEILEEAEIDLLRVMRSHHVDTADNYNSQGITARQKGDLDKIFALYLEKLGGTSQLVQVNNELKVTDLKDVESFLTKLINQSDSLSQYIWDKFTPETQQLINQYQITNTQFSSQDFLKPNLIVIKLIVAKDALTLSLKDKFSEQTRQLLNSYDGSGNVPSELISNLVNEFNHSLNERQLYHKSQDYFVQYGI